jgi:hypothetical protein
MLFLGHSYHLLRQHTWKLLKDPKYIISAASLATLEDRQWVDDVIINAIFELIYQVSRPINHA